MFCKYTANVMNSNNNRYKRTVYQYDLISGKVNSVAYQPPLNGVTQPDAFYHQYMYDAENRLRYVKTSHDSISWEQDAVYSYYPHGPLSRVTLGDQQVQGVDYAYTLQGWLKGVNSTLVGTSFDMGSDGSNSAGNMRARDVFGYALHYYDSTDYQPVGGTNTFARADINGVNYKPLYNGNIAAMSVNIPSAGIPQLYAYTYDQLNRLVRQQTYKGLGSSQNKWTPVSIKDYNESISYDANGNILTYNRYGNPALMDSLAYNYEAGKNRLSSITDKVSSPAYPADIDNQPVSNYAYDSIGNLVKDSAGGIKQIDWTVYGKIGQITKYDGTVIKYTYDAGGNRISKAVTSGGTTTTTWYARDASGNVMGVYTKGDNTVNNGQLTLSEVDMYGSSRLEMWKPGINVQTPPVLTPLVVTGMPTGYFLTFVRGQKLYELTNHLGNVLVTISDKKKGLGSGSTVNYYTADVVSAQDYYPFGMAQPGRNISTGNYRYGFNGKENDNDVKGDGNEQDYGMRIYDTRIGRFLSVDPLASKYIELTPYQFASNRPIDGIDMDGLEYIPYIPKFNNSGNRSFIDYVGAFDNGVIDVLNVVPSLWNSGVSTVQSVRRGSYGEDVKRDFKQVGTALKQSGNQLIKEPLKTLSSPEALEFVTSVYVGGKVLPGGGNKGNLLKPTATKPPIATTASTNSEAQSLLSASSLDEPLVEHHIFNAFRGSSSASQKYRDFFKNLNIKVNEHAILIPESLHKYLHRAGSNWTTQWKNWIDENPNATSKDVYQQAGKMMDDAGVNKVPIKKYKKT